MNDEDRDCYAALADELNDHGVDLTIEDFEPRMVASARVYAHAHGLSWPPGIGDYDRLWERKHNR